MKKIDFKAVIDRFSIDMGREVEDSDNGLKFPSHRYKSWEYCREKFLFYRDHWDFYDTEEKEKAAEELALNLAFYLASWGMYRGSSFLLQYDYKIHLPIIYRLYKTEYRNLFDEDCWEEKKKEKYLTSLFGEDGKNGIVEEICTYYKKCRKKILGEKFEETFTEKDESNNISSILVTKILMGVYGCIPAYDRFFVAAIGAYGIQKTFNKKGVGKLLSELNEKEVKGQIQAVCKELQGKCSVYTPMKVVDMCFWQIGYGEDVLFWDTIHTPADSKSFSEITGENLLECANECAKKDFKKDKEYKYHIEGIGYFKSKDLGAILMCCHDKLKESNKIQANDDLKQAVFELEEANKATRFYNIIKQK